MNQGGFAALFQEMEASPKYQAEKLSVAFLAEVQDYLKDNSITKAEVARRAEVTPQYVTKLFNGSANLSIETMAKLALALDCHIHLHLARCDARVRWFDVHQTDRASNRWTDMDRGRFVKMTQDASALNENGWNDEKFALAA